MPMSFRSLKLGYASAEQEGAYSPELLIEGYLDPSGIKNDILNGSRSIILGYKGSGKSAISEHLRLTAKSDETLFVTTAFLSDFPYQDFQKMIRVDKEGVSQFPTAWSWILLINLFASFERDQDCSAVMDADFQEAFAFLKEMGLIPTPGLRQLVLASAKHSFKFKLPYVFESNLEKHARMDDLKIPFLVERLKKLAERFQSQNKHVLVIDGLDDVLTAGRLQLDSLAGLVLEVSRLNAAFHSSSVPAKIVLLCRTDLYERLPGANKNKIRQDLSVTLDWYHDPSKPGQSRLIQLVNRKAKVNDARIDDLFRTYFPPTVGERHRPQDVVTYLLDLTRHTPRDLIQLLTHIQKFAEGERLTNPQITAGIRSFSIEYFLPEIKDELVGFVKSNDIENVIQLFGSVRKRELRFEELQTAAKSNTKFKHLDLPYLLNCLFECSAIGNIQNLADRSVYFTFKYRNRNSSLNLQDKLVLHRGLWKALNLAQ